MRLGNGHPITKMVLNWVPLYMGPLYGLQLFLLEVRT